MNNGIFVGHKRTTQLAGLGGCGCNGSCGKSGVGDILGQTPLGLVSAVALWGVGVTVLYFMLKSANKPAPARGPYSSMFA